LEEAERPEEEEAKAGAEAASKDKEVAVTQPANVKEKPKDKEFLRIDTHAASPTFVNQRKRRPGPSTSRTLQAVNPLHSPFRLPSPQLALSKT
jgi:hypothetical protein